MADLTVDELRERVNVDWLATYLGNLFVSMWETFTPKETERFFVGEPRRIWLKHSKTGKMFLVTIREVDYGAN